MRPGSKQAGSGRHREPRMRPRTMNEPGFQPGSSNHPWWGRRWASRHGPCPRLTEEIAQGAVAKDRGRTLDGKNSDQLDRRIGRNLLLLLLPALTRGHGLAERAGMPPVEGLAHRGGEGLLTGMVHQHGNPRHSLQRQPMSAHEVQTGENQEEPGKESLHDSTLKSDLRGASEISGRSRRTGERAHFERRRSSNVTPGLRSLPPAVSGLPIRKRRPARDAAQRVRSPGSRDGNPLPSPHTDRQPFP